MKKRKKGRKLSREKNQRRALLETISGALLLREKIKTTEAKAKETSILAEKFITQAKKNTLTSRRLLAKVLPQKIVKKLLEKLGPRYKEKNGGYTKIIKLGPRKSDGAKMAIIELVK